MRAVSKMKKFTLGMVACITLGLALSGCGGSSATADTTAPTATSSLSTTAYTAGPVTITVTASDNGSGVEFITKPDSTKVTSSTATYTVSSNGTYDFVVTDRDGNSAIFPVTVSNIDTTAPTGAYTLSTTDHTAGPVIITVTASDAQSNVASITLPNSTVITASTATYSASVNGIYNFVIADAAGNTTTLPVSVSNIAPAISADDDIAAVTTISFVDVDGPKVQAIVVKYNDTLLAGTVDTSTYQAYSYANLPIVYEDGIANGGTVSNGPESMLPTFARQTGTPGAITYAYVRSTPTIDSNHMGDASGNYVIIELNTNYLLASAIADWRSGVAGSVEQMVPIVSASNAIISPTTTVKSNYVYAYYYNQAPMGNGPDARDHSYWGNMAFDDTLYTLTDIAGYKLYTSNVQQSYSTTYTNQVTGETITAQIPNETVFSMVAGDSYATTNNFSEYDGASHDVNQMYSLFVPSDYDPNKQYMLVLHIEDAGGLGDDPMISLTESQAPANYASDRVQNLAKSYTCSNGQKCGGLIVVVPQMLQSDQDVADNLTGNQFLPATWKLVDHITSTYNIDMNRIYASGQSMGGMQELDMAAQRDNYFAGIWVRGSQWGNNYSKTYTYPTDGTIITNPDWQNWYYSISDDNILVTNMTGDTSSTTDWQLVDTLDNQFAGVTIPYVIWDPTTTTTDQENAQLQSLLAMPNTLGIYWDALSGGSHKMTWIYADTITDSYDWLLSQTKASEDARGKLNLSGSYADGKGTYGYNTPIASE